MLIRNIFNEFNDLKDVMDNFFATTDNHLYHDEPLINLSEKDDQVRISVLAPGVKSENIDLEVIDNILKIKITKDIDDKEHKYLRRERNFGTFSKSVKLPYSIDIDNINANVSNGILNIELNRSEDSKPKKITIQ